MSHFVRVLICILWQNISFLRKFFRIKRYLYFKIEHFCWDIVKFYQFFREFLLQIHFGSWMNIFKIRYPDPDSDTSFWSPRDPDTQHCFQVFSKFLHLWYWTRSGLRDMCINNEYTERIIFISSEKLRSVQFGICWLEDISRFRYSGLLIPSLSNISIVFLSLLYPTVRLVCKQSIREIYFVNSMGFFFFRNICRSEL